MGFVRYRQSHLRMAGEILQVIRMDRISSGRKCRIYFMAGPLSAFWSYYNVFGYFDLEDFSWELDSGGHDYFGYDPRSEASMNACIDRTFSAIDQIIIPYFEKAVDLKNALEALEEYGKRRAADRLNSHLEYVRSEEHYDEETDEEDFDEDESEESEEYDYYSSFVRLHAYHRLLAMKLHRYDEAIKDFEWEKQNALKNIKRKERYLIIPEYRQGDHQKGQRYIDGCKDTIQWCEEWIDRLQRDDTPWIEEFLKNNEEKTKEALRKEIPRLAKKYGV